MADKETQDSGWRRQISKYLSSLAYVAAFSATAGNFYLLNDGEIKQRQPAIRQERWQGTKHLATKTSVPDNVPCVVEVALNPDPPRYYCMNVSEPSEILNRAKTAPVQETNLPYRVIFWRDPREKTHPINDETKKMLSEIIRQQYTNKNIEMLKAKYAQNNN